MAIMTSYNQNNGRPAADDYDLCTAFARDEWGFQGMIMTDWGGGQSDYRCMKCMQATTLFALAKVQLRSSKASNLIQTGTEKVM